jgi:cell division protease FtsH
MVTKWGLSDNLGPLMYEEDDNGSFMGSSRNANVSGEVSKEIDKEIRNLIDRNYQRSVDILKEHADKLEIMTDALMQYETIDAHQIKNIMEGKPPGEPRDWGATDDDSAKPKDSLVEEPVVTDTVADDLSGEHSSTEQGEPKLH